MASPASEPMSARKLTELRVIDLKAQLEKRGIEKTGVKASLIDRLKKALEDEGQNPDDYIFELDMRKMAKDDAGDKEDKMDGDEDDDLEIEPLDADTTLTEDYLAAELNHTTEAEPADTVVNSEPAQDENKDESMEVTPEASKDEAKQDEEKDDGDQIVLSIVDSVALLDEEEEAPVKDGEQVVEEMEATSSAETQQGEEGQGGEVQTAAAAIISVSEPPSPSSVPVIAPFTSEDTVTMSAATERQLDEDISLIVHVDESQMELDNDLLTPAKKSEAAPETAVAEAAAPATEESQPTQETGDKEEVAASENSTSNPDTTTTTSPPEEETDKSKPEAPATDEKKDEAGVSEGEKTAQSKDGDKAKSVPGSKAPAKEAVPASSRNLWISGLATTTRATDLKTLFTKYGKVAGAKVVTNAKSPGSRCYGFVTMSTADEASKCIQHLHRTELHGKMISVERAKTDPSAHAKAAPKAGGEKREPQKDRREDRKPGGSRRSGYSSDHRPRSRSRDSRHERRGSGPHRTPPSARPPRPDQATAKEKELLDFDKIKAEREHERLRERERRLRVEERRRLTELERMRRSQSEVERRQRDEAVRLEREKQRLKLEQQRLELERLEAERERIALERERQRRERERLEKEREQERQAQLRIEQERRAMKRNFESRGPAAREDNWSDAKRPYVERAKEAPAPPRGKHEERGNTEFERRVERYDRRVNEQPQRSAGERYDNNRREERHDARREVPPARDARDRDDRAAHAPADRARSTHDAGRYNVRREAPPAQHTHDSRQRHERERSPPHRAAAPPRASPAHRQPDTRADWKPERPTIPSRDTTRERRPPPAAERSFPDSRAPQTTSHRPPPPARTSNSRDSSWHNGRGSSAVQEERTKGHSFSTGPGSGPGPMGDHQWSSTDRNPPAPSQPLSSRPGERSWPVSGSQQTERLSARPAPSTIQVQPPLLQTPQPSSAAFLASAANIMMGVGLAGNRSATQDTRYDAYKNMQGGNVRRY